MPPEPSQPIDVVKSLYDTWNGGEWGLEHIDPQVEWELSDAAFDQTGPMRGRDSLLRYFRRFWAAWEPGARWEIDETRPIDEPRVLCCGQIHATGRTSGLEVAIPVFHVWTVRDGLVTRLRAYDDRDSALEAEG